MNAEHNRQNNRMQTHPGDTEIFHRIRETLDLILELEESSGDH